MFFTLMMDVHYFFKVVFKAVFLHVIDVGHFHVILHHLEGMFQERTHEAVMLDVFIFYLAQLVE